MGKDARRSQARAKLAPQGQRGDSVDADRDYLAQKSAGQRGRLANRRGDRRTRRAYSPKPLSRRTGNSAKTGGWFDAPASYAISRYRRAELRRYVAGKNKRCRAPGFAATLEAEDEGRGGGEGEDGSRKTGAGADGGELRPPERSMEDITWLLEASRTLGRRGAGPARGQGVQESRLLPAPSSAFSARSSDSWEVVDGTFDVRSMEDVELG
eukprot:evm.model.scf_1286.4 EVM.evm.TU.scf_1286.4   scf_1286:23453-24085(+)